MAGTKKSAFKKFDFAKQREANRKNRAVTEAQSRLMKAQTFARQVESIRQAAQETAAVEEVLDNEHGLIQELLEKYEINTATLSVAISRNNNGHIVCELSGVSMTCTDLKVLGPFVNLSMSRNNVEDFEDEVEFTKLDQLLSPFVDVFNARNPTYRSHELHGRLAMAAMTGIVPEESSIAKFSRSSNGYIDIVVTGVKLDCEEPFQPFIEAQLVKVYGSELNEDEVAYLELKRTAQVSHATEQNQLKPTAEASGKVDIDDEIWPTDSSVKEKARKKAALEEKLLEKDAKALQEAAAKKRKRCHEGDVFLDAPASKKSRSNASQATPHTTYEDLALPRPMTPEEKQAFDHRLEASEALVAKQREERAAGVEAPIEVRYINDLPIPHNDQVKVAIQDGTLKDYDQAVLDALVSIHKVTVRKSKRADGNSQAVEAIMKHFQLWGPDMGRGYGKKTWIKAATQTGKPKSDAESKPKPAPQPVKQAKPKKEIVIPTEAEMADAYLRNDLKRFNKDLKYHFLKTYSSKDAVKKSDKLHEVDIYIHGWYTSQYTPKNIAARERAAAEAAAEAAAQSKLKQEARDFEFAQAEQNAEVALAQSMEDADTEGTHDTLQPHQPNAIEPRGDMSRPIGAFGAAARQVHRDVDSLRRTKDAGIRKTKSTKAPSGLNHDRLAAALEANTSQNGANQANHEVIDLSNDDDEAAPQQQTEIQQPADSNLTAIQAHGEPTSAPTQLEPTAPTGVAHQPGYAESRQLKANVPRYFMDGWGKVDPARIRKVKRTVPKAKKPQRATNSQEDSEISQLPQQQQQESEAMSSSSEIAPQLQQQQEAEAVSSGGEVAPPSQQQEAPAMSFEAPSEPTSGPVNFNDFANENTNNLTNVYFPVPAPMGDSAPQGPAADHQREALNFDATAAIGNNAPQAPAANHQPETFGFDVTGEFAAGQDIDLDALEGLFAASQDIDWDAFGGF